MEKQLQLFMERAAADVEAELKALLPADDERCGRLIKAINYGVFTGGKRLRPTAFFAVLDALGTERKPYLSFAAAIEMIHSYSLIHDDLPAMDDDDFRRGKPTVHKIFGESTAILAGDGLLTYAFIAMMKNRAMLDANRLMNAMEMVADCAGLGGMVAGQAVDVLANMGNTDLEALLYIHENKTGKLFLASLVSAAILAGADKKTQEALHRYALSAGLAFQIIDDVMDLREANASGGKIRTSDMIKHKMTFPVLLGIAASEQMAQEKVEEAKAAIAFLGERGLILNALADYLVQMKV